MKKMTAVVITILSGICLSVIVDTAYAGTVCTCEDWDNDGRFGVVTYQAASKQIVDANIGNYTTCMSYKAKTSICRNNLCICEDWDGDGRFGAVVYFGVNKSTIKVLKPNVGNYYNCVSYKSSLDQCK